VCYLQILSRSCPLTLETTRHNEHCSQKNTLEGSYFCKRPTWFHGAYAPPLPTVLSWVVRTGIGKTGLESAAGFVSFLRFLDNASG
jgi:hypothetical protein